jgi:hypothetical protein
MTVVIFRSGISKSADRAAPKSESLETIAVWRLPPASIRQNHGRHVVAMRSKRNQCIGQPGPGPLPGLQG